MTDSNLIILDPLNLSNNTARNSFHTSEIIQSFHCAYSRLKTHVYPMYPNKQVDTVQLSSSKICSGSIAVQNAEPTFNQSQTVEEQQQETGLHPSDANY